MSTAPDADKENDVTLEQYRMAEEWLATTDVSWSTFLTDMKRAAESFRGLTERQAEAVLRTREKVLAGSARPSSGPAEVGFYARDGEVFKVQTSKTSGRNYALRLVVTTRRSGQPRGSWEYAGVVFDLTPEQRLSVEQAAQAGRITGVCVICGAALIDPESIERGIGPVCATRV